MTKIWLILDILFNILMLLFNIGLVYIVVYLTFITKDIDIGFINTFIIFFYPSICMFLFYKSIEEKFK